MNDDAALLCRYAEEKSEAAFAELVRRHVDLVYSAAFRRLSGDAHGAADVAQQVFTTLACDAGKLSRHAVLTAWLYTATRNAAIDLLRSEQRRRTREQEAFTMQISLEATPAPDWEKLRPVIDEVMDELPDADRTAVLLRYFERRPFAEVGTALLLSEDAARMRVDRALEKLRVFLARRGVTSTGGALTAALANHAAVAVPAGLATSVVGAALATAGGASASGLTTSILVPMSTSKISVGLAGLLLLATLGVTFRQSSISNTRDAATAAARAENAALAAKVREVNHQADTVMSEIALMNRAITNASTTTTETATPVRVAGRGGGGRGSTGSDDTNTSEALEAGKEFLVKYPEARRALELAQRAGFDRNPISERYAALQLSPEEYEAVYAEYARLWPWQLRLSSGPGWSIGGSNGSSSTIDPFVRALVGDERFERVGSSSPADNVLPLVQAFSGATNDLDSPLSPQQAAALVRTLEQHSPRRIPGSDQTLLNGPP